MKALKVIAKIIGFLSLFAGLVWSCIQIYEYLAKRPTIATNLDNSQIKSKVLDTTKNKYISYPKSAARKEDSTHKQADISMAIPEEIHNSLNGGICVYSLNNDTEYGLMVKLTYNNNRGRAVYVPAGKKYIIPNCPEGTYTMKYAYGTGWDSKRKKFTKDTIYKAARFPIDLRAVETRIVRDGDIVRRKVCESGMTFRAKDINDNNTTAEDFTISESKF